MPSFSIRLGIAVVALSSLLACGGPEPEPQPPPAPGPQWAGTCERIDGLVNAQRSCGRDDDCPCGTHCELGKCAVSCTWNTDCGENQVCDGFGRCVAPEAVSGVRSVAGGSRGVLLADRTQLSLQGPQSVEQFRVSARLLDVAPVRISAEAGLEVACGDGEFSPECVFEVVAPSADAQRVRVRASGAQPAEDVRRAVLLHAPGQRVAVGVQVVGSQPAPVTPRHGLYEGKAILRGAGLKLRSTEDTLPDELSRLELKVTAEIFPEQGGVYTLKLADARQTVFPHGSVATLALKSGSSDWRLSMPSRQYLGEDSDMVAASTLDVHASGEMDAPIFRAGLLDGDLVITFEGLAPAAQAPFARWHVTLVRVGDLPAGVTPPAVEPRVVTDVVARAQQALSEEAAVVSVTGTLPGTAVGRAIAALCRSSSSDGTATFAATTTGPNQTGDLLCTGGARQKAFGIEAGKLQDRGDYVSDCVASLRPDAPLTPTDASAAARCLDRTRAVSAMALALEQDRLRALGLATTPDLSGSRVGLRVVQQWLSAQTIAAREPRRLHTLAPLLPEGPSLAGLARYEDRAEVLAALRSSIGAWDVVLHPRVSTALVAAPPEALHSPDYRPTLTGNSYPDGEQRLGLPVNMLLALSRQLESLEGSVQDLVLYRATPSERDTITRELSLALPRNLVIFAFAQGLRDAARSSSLPAWENHWLSARIGYGAAMAKLMRQIEFMESGANPLGIDDVDLPLYRLGDQEGTSRRFAAVSDSLLGREDLLDPAIAPTLLEQAGAAAAQAKASVTALLQRDLQEATEATGSARRLEGVHRHYGEQITSFCGAWDSLAVLNTPEVIDEDSCFLEEGCQFTLDQINDRLSTADLGYQICLAAKLRERFGDSVTTGQAALDAQLSQISGSMSAESDFFNAGIGNDLLAGFETAYEGQDPVRIDLPTGVDNEAVAEVEALCDSARQKTLSLRPSATPASCTKTDECPAGLVCQSASSSCIPDDSLPDPECFRGSMGTVAVALMGASAEVDIARSELEEYSERYDNAMRGCIILQQGNDAAEGAMRAHDATMAQMAQAKFAADTAAKVAEKAAGLFSLDSPGKVFGAAAFGAVQQAAESTSDTIAMKMDATQRQHELTLATLENQTEERLCFNEAEAELVGARSAALRVRSQAIELARQLVEFRNLKINLLAARDEGLASLQFEALRRIAPAQVDHWLDANVDLFEQRMRRARRALYLAVLAVEYEFQLSSSERALTLAARTPAELEGVLSRLRDLIRRGAPQDGGNPTELLTVVSLRRNLMQVADRSEMGEGWHALDEESRFRQLLVSPRYASYGPDGRYLGQEIPFTIQPLGTLGLGDTGAIPLLSGLNCAERLWSLNVSVLGDELMHRTDSSIVTMQIRKRNTFASQFCSSDYGDQTLQTASTRPSRNLFIDPYSASSWAEDGTLTALTDTQEATAFAPSTVQARLNVSRTELEKESYQDGESRALAGRGVFGDYSLFIPATTQSISGTTGLRLENVKDVLIRLDYVAAERR